MTRDIKLFFAAIASFVAGYSTLESKELKAKVRLNVFPVD